MKKIILALIFSLFLINISFADPIDLCKYKYINKEWFYHNKDKDFEKFLKNCNWDEAFWIILKENWNFFYYVWWENRNVRFYLNDKLVAEEKVDEVFKWTIFLSKYWNHFTFWFKEFNDKEYDLRENYIYIDNVKKLHKINYNFIISEIFENFDETYYLSEIKREKIDNFLKNFLENKENFSKIDEIISKAENFKKYSRSLEQTEIYNYIISELKIFKLKNS